MQQRIVMFQKFCLLHCLIQALHLIFFKYIVLMKINILFQTFFHHGCNRHQTDRVNVADFKNFFFSSVVGPPT